MKDLKQWFCYRIALFNLTSFIVFATITASFLFMGYNQISPVKRISQFYLDQTFYNSVSSARDFALKVEGNNQLDFFKQINTFIETNKKVRKYISGYHSMYRVINSDFSKRKDLYLSNETPAAIYAFDDLLSNKKQGITENDINKLRILLNEYEKESGLNAFVTPLEVNKSYFSKSALKRLKSFIKDNESQSVVEIKDGKVFWNKAIYKFGENNQPSSVIAIIPKSSDYINSSFFTTPGNLLKLHNVATSPWESYIAFIVIFGFTFLLITAIRSKYLFIVKQSSNKIQDSIDECTEKLELTTKNSLMMSMTLLKSSILSLKNEKTDLLTSNSDIAKEIKSLEKKLDLLESDTKVKTDLENRLEFFKNTIETCNSAYDYISYQNKIEEASAKFNLNTDRYNDAREKYMSSLNDLNKLQSVNKRSTNPSNDSNLIEQTDVLKKSFQDSLSDLKQSESNLETLKSQFDAICSSMTPEDLTKYDNAIANFKANEKQGGLEQAITDLNKHSDYVKDEIQFCLDKIDELNNLRHKNNDRLISIDDIIDNNEQLVPQLEVDLNENGIELSEVEDASTNLSLLEKRKVEFDKQASALSLKIKDLNKELDNALSNVSIYLDNQKNPGLLVSLFTSKKAESS